jgi:hypothetical protein
MSCHKVKNAIKKEKMMWPFVCNDGKIIMLLMILSNFHLCYHSWQGDC